MESIIDEERFNAWLESIRFVGPEGAPMPTVLAKDESDDTEGDRG